MLKRFIFTAFVIFMSAHSALCATKIGSVIYINENVIQIDCSNVVDNGVGMEFIDAVTPENSVFGKMRFRAEYATHNAAWTEWMSYAKLKKVVLAEVVPNKQFKITGEFCDILNNCQGENAQTTDEYLILDDAAPTGGVKIVITVVIGSQ